MIGAYVIVLLVFGIVLSYLGLIHHFWLRGVFSQDYKHTLDAKTIGVARDFREANLGSHRAISMPQVS